MGKKQRGVAQFGSADALGALGRRFESCHPDCLNMTTMKDIPFYTVEYWQENWDAIISRVENGETLGIEDGKNRAVMVPADDELFRIYTENNNEAS